MDINEKILHIESKRNKTNRPKRMQVFMDRIQHPYKKLSCIHIGGTNGKGSTTNYVRSILQEAGLKVGSFTSPYLETHFDRYRINDVPMDEASFHRYYDDMITLWEEYELSAFEIDMCLACLYFVDQEVDVAIFEVGLGGRLDATNVITPVVSAITNIGLDHMEILGDSYEKIAVEKAGIIKDNVPFITGETKASCLKIFKQVCEEHHAPFTVLNQASYEIQEKTIAFLYEGEIYKLNTLATYQVENAALALAIIDIYVSKYHLDIPVEIKKYALFHALWKGRFEIVKYNPTIILDGAHNMEGIRALCKSIAPMKQVKVLFSALKDKPFDQMLDTLVEASDQVYVCAFDFYRAASIEELSKHPKVIIVENPKDFILSFSEEEGSLMICGSLYFISQVYEMIK